MYILYLDESGNPNNAEDKHFVLGGLAIYERQTYFLSRALDGVEEQFFPGSPPIEFHASHMRGGRGLWRKLEAQKREKILEAVGITIAASNEPGVVLFGAVVEKSRDNWGEAVLLSATEQVCKRFDTFLSRRENEESDPERGLIVFAQGSYDQRAKLWVRDFRKLGTQWGTLKRLSDIPYFGAASDSRLLQAADYVAHALFVLYEQRNDAYAGILLSRFDQKKGVLHGLAHMTSSFATCGCPACRSRRTPGTLGDWVKPHLSSLRLAR